MPKIDLKEDTFGYHFTDEERANATELLGELSLQMNHDGVFLVFAGTQDTDRKLFYPLHSIGSDQIDDVAETLKQMSGQLRLLETLGGDDSASIGTAPTSCLIH
jgi:hypothetical protein